MVFKKMLCMILFFGTINCLNPIQKQEPNMKFNLNSCSSLNYIDIKKCNNSFKFLTDKKILEVECSLLPYLEINSPMYVLTDNNELKLFKNKMSCPIIPTKISNASGCWNIYHDFILILGTFTVSLLITTLIRRYYKILKIEKERLIKINSNITESMLTESDRRKITVSITKRKYLLMFLVTMLIWKPINGCLPTTEFSATLKNSWMFSVNEEGLICRDYDQFLLKINPQIIKLNLLYSLNSYKWNIEDFHFDGSILECDYAYKMNKPVEYEMFGDEFGSETIKKESCLVGGNRGFFECSGVSCFNYKAVLTGKGYLIYDVITKSNSAYLNHNISDCTATLLNSADQLELSNKFIVKSAGFNEGKAYICSLYEINQAEKFLAKLKMTNKNFDFSLPHNPVTLNSDYYPTFIQSEVDNPFQSCLELPTKMSGYKVTIVKNNILVSPSQNNIVEVSCLNPWKPKVTNGNCFVKKVIFISAEQDLRGDYAVISTTGPGMESSNIRIDSDCLPSSLIMPCGTSLTAIVSHAFKNCTFNGVIGEVELLDPWYDSLNQQIHYTTNLGEEAHDVDYKKLIIPACIGLGSLMILATILNFFKN